MLGGRRGLPGNKKARNKRLSCLLYLLAASALGVAGPIFLTLPYEQKWFAVIPIILFIVFIFFAPEYD
jgi:VIT1/CCC1 family predicted Fe2+/Mn2+ transporter